MQRRNFHRVKTQRRAEIRRSARAWVFGVEETFELGSAEGDGEKILRIRRRVGDRDPHHFGILRGGWCDREGNATEGRWICCLTDVREPRPSDARVDRYVNAITRRGCARRCRITVALRVAKRGKRRHAA